MPTKAKTVSRRLYPSTTTASESRTTFAQSKCSFGVGSTIMSANTSPTAAQPSAVTANAPRSSLRPVPINGALSHPRRAALRPVALWAAHGAVYAVHSDRAHRLFASLSSTDQRHLRRILAHLAETLTETSAAEGKPLDLDPTTFRGSRAAPTQEP